MSSPYQVIAKAFSTVYSWGIPAQSSPTMTFDPFLDLVPPRPPSPPPPPVQPYAVELPDELLRHIFELAFDSNPHTARQLMLVSKWVRAWVVRAYYEITFVKARGHLRQLAARPDRLLAKTRCLWIGLSPAQAVRELLARTPGVTSLAMGMPNLPAPLHYVLPSAVRLRELEILDVGFGVALDLAAPVFSALTHLRLEQLHTVTVAQLASSVPPILPALTHFAVDDCVAADDCRRILAAPSRVNLLVFVVVVGRWVAGAYVRGLRVLALPRLVVLVGEDRRARGSDWLARTRGESGFWERAAQRLDT